VRRHYTYESAEANLSWPLRAASGSLRVGPGLRAREPMRAHDGALGSLRAVAYTVRRAEARATNPGADGNIEAAGARVCERELAGGRRTYQHYARYRRSGSRGLARLDTEEAKRPAVAAVLRSCLKEGANLAQSRATPDWQTEDQLIPWSRNARRRSVAPARADKSLRGARSASINRT